MGRGEKQIETVLSNVAGIRGAKKVLSVKWWV
jgi:hypothetical protein